jgi:hypothetical protein
VRSGIRLRAGLVERLRARRPEIEQTILTRVYSVSDPLDAGDPAYVAGLRAAVSAALSHGIAGIEEGKAEPAPIPPALFAQARHAARNGVSIDTVLRRYFAGYTLLGDFVMQEAEEDEAFGVEELQALGKTQAMLFDRLVVAVSAEYRSEVEGGAPSIVQRRVECVRKLLGGELADTSELAYDLDGWHLGVVASGARAQRALRSLAGALDRRLLLVLPGEDTLWGWLGGKRKVEAERAVQLAASDWPEEASLAIGEPAHGVPGWRLTHRQALAALPVSLRGSQGIVRYADVALLASMLGDDLLTISLHKLYLAPLSDERDGGAALRQTARAYFDADGNASSAAAALAVSRHTVTGRLRLIEERLGRPLSSCVAEMDAALRFHDLLDSPPRLRPISEHSSASVR